MQTFKAWHPNPQEEPLLLFSSPGTEAGDLAAGAVESGLPGGNHLGLTVYLRVVPSLPHQLYVLKF